MLASVFTVNNRKERTFLRTKIPPLVLEKESKKELKELVVRMRRIMKNANGIGLSANQIGLKKRLFIAELPSGKGRPKFYAILNPQIIKTSDKKVKSEEGCLSIPEIYGFVERSDRIILQGYNLQGKKIKIKAWGILAKVFQHEVDHLDGKLFIDRTKEIYKVEKTTNS